MVSDLPRQNRLACSVPYHSGCSAPCRHKHMRGHNCNLCSQQQSGLALCSAGITSNELADPTLPSLAELTHGLVQFVASHTPAGAEPVVVAHNSHRAQQ